MGMDASAQVHLMAELPPNPQLLSALGRLVRGLSALFWGLPIALIVCVQTAKTDWLRGLGIIPPMLALALVYFGLDQLGGFQKQERIWRSALDRARILAIANIGLSPFLYWWNRLPGNTFYTAIVDLMLVLSLFFLFSLNLVLRRLTAMLPDETLRIETRLFTTMNGYLLALTMLVLGSYVWVSRMEQFPQIISFFVGFLERTGMWAVVFLTVPILLPIAMTMALIWKVKEVILASVFGDSRNGS